MPSASKVGPVRWRRRLEGLLLLSGGLLLAFGIGIVALGEIRRAEALEALPDMQDWSAGARARYLAAISEERSAEPASTLGSLHIAAIDLEVPVYADSSRLNLDRGAAVVDGMAYPHERGHIGIAGHRDGYFRALRDLRKGDRIHLETLHGRRVFVVDELRIVDPEDLSLLAETRDPRLTLVTCYPFNYVGSAPQRYLVRAGLANATGDAGTAALPPMQGHDEN
ncbi:MAG: class D sortase [Halieaceae bacterium]|jgi:sortase A|nr:class D sortase [Halieaceae bacterium]